MALKYVQTNTLYLAGSGVIIGATSIVLTGFTDIYGNVLTMADFGTKGYITLEPDTTNEEAAIFTGVTANANGTYTLTGISTILAKSPYTETSSLVRAHSGGTKVVVTDNVGFWNTFANKNNDETIAGQWTFTTFPITPSGNATASTTVAGTVQLATATQMLAKTRTGSVGPYVLTPDLIPSTLLSDYKADTGAVNAYAIAPSPAIAAYTVGQIFSFKATNANTGTSTLAVNGLSAQTIKKSGGATDLLTGDIIAGQIVMVEYDGTNFQLLSNPGDYISYQVQTFSGASGTWTKPTGAKLVQILLVGGGGQGGNGVAGSTAGAGAAGGSINTMTINPAVLAPTVSVIVGAAGQSTASQFGSLLYAAPGGPGGSGGGVATAAGGTPGTAPTAPNGLAGVTGITNNGGVGGSGSSPGGYGSFVGAGGAGGSGAANGGTGGTGAGGGGGGNSTGATGGAGGPGFAQVTTYF